MLKDYRLSPLNSGKPQRVLILLHGLGDSGSGGLLSIGQIWQETLPALRDCEFLCPDAPFPFDMGPPDFAGRQWFSLQSFTPESVLAGVKTAAPLLNDYIDQVLASRGLNAAQLALVGFSQGTMMALYTALRRSDPVACVIGYSGMLVNGAALAAEKKSAPPVLLVHGLHDDVVPYTRMDEAERQLREAGVPVESVTCPTIAHSIDQTGIEAGMKFLAEHF